MSSPPPATFRDALVHAWPRHRARVVPALVATLTLGLAPYYPHAHVWKQLVSLARGTLTEAIDVFDLVLHGAPWVVLAIFLARMFLEAARSTHPPAAKRPETEVS